MIFFTNLSKFFLVFTLFIFFIQYDYFNEKITIVEFPVFVVHYESLNEYVCLVLALQLRPATFSEIMADK